MIVGMNHPIVIPDDIRSVELDMADKGIDIVTVHAGEPAPKIYVASASHRSMSPGLSLAAMMALFSTSGVDATDLLPDPMPFAERVRRQEKAQAYLEKAQLKRDRRAAKRLKDAS